MTSTGAAPVDDAGVVIERDRISWAGPAAGAPPTPGAVRVDLDGHALCPGFFDCHVHFGLPGSAGRTGSPPPAT
ncbi:hypothetical protein ACXDF8_21575 [Mycolicibacterium sp. CBM1]